MFVSDQQNHLFNFFYGKDAKTKAQEEMEQKALEEKEAIEEGPEQDENIRKNERKIKH